MLSIGAFIGLKVDCGPCGCSLPIPIPISIQLRHKSCGAGAPALRWLRFGILSRGCFAEWGLSGVAVTPIVDFSVYTLLYQRMFVITRRSPGGSLRCRLSGWRRLSSSSMGSRFHCSNRWQTMLMWRSLKSRNAPHVAMRLRLCPLCSASPSSGICWCKQMRSISTALFPCS